MKMTSNSCVVCKSPVEEILLQHQSPDRFEQYVGITEKGYRREWRQCSHCGLAVNIMPEANLALLAPVEANYYDIDFPGIDLNDRFKKIMGLPKGNSDNMARVMAIFEALDRVSLSGGKALDIGAGLGVFLAAFGAIAAEKGQSWHLTGIEPDNKAAAHLEKLRLFELVHAAFPVELPSRYNLITLNKVVEHFSGPEALLNLLPDYLDRATGLLYVEVPDALTALYRAPEDNILGCLHRHLYTPESLSMLLRKCGFETLRVERYTDPSGKLSVRAFACLPEMAAKLSGQL